MFVERLYRFVAVAKITSATVASKASIRPRPPSSKPKKRPCSSALAIIFTRLRIEAQKVSPVVRPQQQNTASSTENPGAVEYTRPSAPVAINEKQIRKRGAT